MSFIFHSPKKKALSKSKSINEAQSNDPNVIFGKSLQEVFDQQNDYCNTHGVPNIIREPLFILYEQCADSTKGIFRVSGSQSHIRVLRQVYNATPPAFTLTKLRQSGVTDLHSIAGLLKSFLNELPHALVGDQKVRAEFLEVFNLENDDNLENSNPSQVNALKHIVHTKMHQQNRIVLQRLCEFLACIARQASLTAMTADNLGLIFGPAFLQGSKLPSAKAINELSSVHRVAALLIENATYIFGEYNAEKTTVSKRDDRSILAKNVSPSSKVADPLSQTGVPVTPTTPCALSATARARLTLTRTSSDLILDGWISQVSAQLFDATPFATKRESESEDREKSEESKGAVEDDEEAMEYLVLAERSMQTFSDEENEKSSESEKESEKESENEGENVVKASACTRSLKDTFDALAIGKRILDRAVSEITEMSEKEKKKEGEKVKKKEKEGETDRGVTSVDVKSMSDAALQEMKRNLKTKLREFDAHFSRIHQRSPLSAEKEHLRGEYAQLATIKDEIIRRRLLSKTASSIDSQHVKPVSDASLKSTSPVLSKRVKRVRRAVHINSATTFDYGRVDVEALLAERAHLRELLHIFRSDFRRQHGRDIMYHADREPVQVEYARYQELKRLLTTLPY